MKVCILLSTYNGEKFLEEQLYSLMSQEGVDIELLVRDDGSKDATIAILDKWQDKGMLKWYSGKNLGFAKSFMDLLMNAGSCDYYAFCDQDDIWLPNKLITAVNCLEKLEGETKLYCSNLFYYKNGINSGTIRKVKPEFTAYTCLVQNIAVGCTIVFDKGLRETMLHGSPDFLIAHDYWAYQTAMILGQVYYDENAYILYRQHDNNQIGAKVSFWDIWKRRFKSFFRSKAKESRALQAEELLRCYSDMMNDDIRQIIATVAYYNASIKNKLRLFLDTRYTMGSALNDILLRIRIISGKL